MLELFFFFITAPAQPHAIWVACVITKEGYVVSYGWTEAVIKKAIQPFLAATVMQKPPVKAKQGRIYSIPVADGWAGVVMRKPLGN